MGGTVMGEDPRHSVTDSYGRTHDVENLFLAGPGLFPSVGSGPSDASPRPLLAARTASYISSQWSALSAA